MQFQRTFQTAGYIRPYPLTTSEVIITRSCQTWQLLGKVSDDRADRNDNYDEFKTHLHSLMHNRCHQPEF